MLSNFKLLKFVYRGLLTGMPLLTYNPISKTSFHAPLIVNPYSTYINFKLNNFQTNYLNDYIKQYSENLTIVPIKVKPNEKEHNYLSINIYNCSSPIFMNNKDITRCEINTYVKDNSNNYGTLIIDYLSDELSMDPVNIFKKSEHVKYRDNDIYKLIDCFSEKDNVKLSLNYTLFREEKFDVDDSLIEYTDNVYYKNGILDKIYYDSSLTNADTREPRYYYNLTFKYKDLHFDNADSIFYFVNPIRFVGSIWNNLYNR